MHITEQYNIPGAIMLIDFEKAFNSILWKFLYIILQHFGFSKNFLKWIQFFDSDITAFVVQCGILSEKIKIERGCKEGDPILSYLFLTTAEILALLIKINPEIIGRKINTKEFKLMQFADDTILFYMAHNTLCRRH